MRDSSPIAKATVSREQISVTVACGIRGNDFMACIEAGGPSGMYWKRGGIRLFKSWILEERREVGDPKMSV